MAKTEKKEISVYADWQELPEPKRMGRLTVSQVRGKEIFSFEYTMDWLNSGLSQLLDPELQLYPGAFYPSDEKKNFGVFLDSSPDRWGRVLMQRREAVTARLEGRPPRELLESDYLLGVFDGHRMGALRFKTEEKGPFLNDNKEMASPPWTALRELQEASLKFEEHSMDDHEYLKWINMLIAPGSSLGGARPKASVLDPKGGLWIAKFPGRMDDKDVGAWEMVVNELAQKAGLKMSLGTLVKFNNSYHTYLTRRFDRTEEGKRIHFASAMTLLGYSDGERSAGASYLEIVEFINRHGASAEGDLKELWTRVVFNICVKNTDDHLRNHGFLLTEAGWLLSPAYDVNANEYGKGLHLNISDKDNSLSLDLALEVAGYFRVDNKTAMQIIRKIKKTISGWHELAGKYKIPKVEQDRMSQAFLIQ